MLIQLRRLSLKDQAATFKLRNDARVYRWCRQFAPLHWDRHAEWFAWQARSDEVEMFAVDNSLGDLVGVCGLTSIDRVNRRAEFSLYVDPAAQKAGYGYEALRELFSFGFNALGLNRIWGETFDGNPAISLFTKLGMELEGTRKEFYYRDGCFINAHLYSLSARDFNRLFNREPKVVANLANDGENARKSRKYKPAKLESLR